MNFLGKLSLLVIDRSIGKRCAPDIFHAKLRVPLAVKIKYLKAPLLLMLQSINDCLQIAAIGAMRSKKLDDLEATIIVGDFLHELLLINEIRVRHIPFFTLDQTQQHKQ